MQLGVDGVFVGSGIFKGDNPAQRAKAMVMAATHYRDPRVVARVSGWFLITCFLFLRFDFRAFGQSHGRNFGSRRELCPD